MKTQINDLKRQVLNMDIYARILFIVQAAIEISQNTKADIFVSYSAHINQLSIRGYSLGWQKGIDADLFVSPGEYDTTINLDENSGTYKENIKKLNKVAEQLAAMHGLYTSIEAAKEIFGAATAGWLAVDATEGIKKCIESYIEHEKDLIEVAKVVEKLT